MKKCFGHILVLMAAVMFILASCEKNKTVVIPRDDMARIYAEMLLTDQWIINTPNVRLIADTSLVYDPILEKYGYDADDYRLSVDRYMDDPERFAKILRNTVEILDARHKDLEFKKAEMIRLDALKSKAEKYRPDIKWEKAYRRIDDHRYIAPYDSLKFEMDSTGRYNIVYVERKDTVYDGIKMVLEVPDTVAVDSVEKKDTVPSIKKEKMFVPAPIKEKRKMVAPVFMKKDDDVKVK